MKNKDTIEGAIDPLEFERKAIFAIQELDTQFKWLKPWLEYRKATAEKYLKIPRSFAYEELIKTYESLLRNIDQEIIKLLVL